MGQLNPMDEKRKIIEYYRNLQRQQNQAVEMVATQQVQCNCASALQSGQGVAAPQPEQPSGSQPVYVIPGVSVWDIEPLRTIRCLTITDWLLVAIAILLVINIIRKK